MGCWSGFPLGSAVALCLLACVVECSDVHECGFWEVVAFAVAESFEAVDGVFEACVDAGEAGEDFGDVEGLAEESFDFACAGDDEFVVFAEFIDAEDGDDVLEVFVPLERALHLACDGVMALADDARIEDGGG